MKQLEQAFQQLQETPEEKICEIFAEETKKPPVNSSQPTTVEECAAFFYEGKVTIVDHQFPDCRSIVLNETSQDPDNPDDALSLEDILPHVVFLAEPSEHERNNLRLRIVIERLDAE